MRIRRSTRWIIVLSAIAVLGLAGGAVYAWRQQAFAQRVADWRTDGLAFVEQAQYQQALYKLSPYLQEQPDDLEALLAFAEARTEVPTERNQHLAHAISVYQQALQVDPDQPEARTRLLSLYDRVGFNTEAVDLADQILTEQPERADAIQVKAKALSRMREYDRALPLAQQYNELAPKDLEGQIRTLSIMRAAGESREALLQRARSMRQANAEDPVFELLVGYAHQLTGQPEAALRAYQAGADAALDRPDVLGRLVRLYDQLDRGDDALVLLRRAVGRSDDPELIKLLTRRLWQAQNYQELQQRLADRDAADIPDESLALLAMTQMRLGELEPVQTSIDELNRRDSATAQAWADILLAMRSDSSDRGAALATAATTALQQDSGNPYLLMILGRAQAMNDDTERALESWRSAAESAPSWADPLVAIAETMLSTNRPRLAIDAARGALARDDDNIEAALLFVSANAAQMDSLSDTGREQLAGMLDRLEEMGIDQTMLHARVALLAEQGQTQAAIDRLRAAINADPPPSPAMLVRLARVSQAHGLGLADQAFEAIDQPDRLNPGVALPRALWVAERESTAAGRDYLQQQLDQADEDAIADWNVALARYLDATGIDPATATDTWQRAVGLADNDRAVLLAALNSPTVWDDRQLAATAIEKLRNLGGEEDARWRIERARWLMSGPGAEGNLPEATALLVEATTKAPYLAEPEIMLSECYQRLGNPERQLQSLEKAQQLQPNSPSIALRRASALSDLGRNDEARRLSNALADSGRLTDRQQFTAAKLLNDLGEPAEALQAAQQLTDGQGDGDTNPATWLMIAKLNDGLDRVDPAANAYDRALELAPEDPQILVAAADFRRRQGQPAAAAELTDRLQALPPADGRPALALASAAEARGDTQQAMATYRRALDANPSLADAWQSLAVLQARSGEFDQALQLARQARDNNAATPGLDALLEQAPLIQQLQGFAIARPIFPSLITDAANREATIQALQRLAEAARSNQPIDTLVTRLAQLADRNPGFLQLQLVTMDLYSRLGRDQQVRRRAEQLMQRFPNAALPAQLAARAAEQAGDWRAAVSAGQAWRERANGSSEADLLIARAQIRLGQTTAAAERMAQTRESAPSPELSSEALTLQTRALIEGGRVEEAAELLRPRLSQAPRWRQTWMGFASMAIDDPGIAAAWLEEVAPLIPTPEERIDLAAAWWTLHRRSPDAQADQIVSRVTQLLESASESGEPSARAYEMLGVINGVQGNTQAAIDYYEQALALDPDRSQAGNNLANLFLQQGRDLERAESLARRAIEAAPNTAAYFDTLGEVLAARGQFDSAEQAMQQAIQLQPNNVMWYINLGQVLVQADRIERARELVDQIEQGITDPDRLPEQIRTDLQELRESVPPQTTRSGANAQRPSERRRQPAA